MKQYKLVTIKECPNCKSTTFSTVANPKDFRATGDRFSVQQCESCGFVFTNPKPVGEDLAFFYNSENYISHNNSNEGLFNKIYQAVRNVNLRNKLSLLNTFQNKGLLLDIGCGTGEFLNTCQHDGWRVIGLEPAPLARDFGVKTYGLEIHLPDALFAMQPCSIDAVTMWHVLEHVEDLEGYITAIHAALVDKGVFIVAVPNHESHDAKFYGDDWAAWDVPIHLSHFSKATMEKWVTKFGFEQIGVKNMLFDSFYVSMLSEKNRNSKLGVIRGAFRGLVSNLYAGADNASSLIYVFRKS